MPEKNDHLILLPMPLKEEQKKEFIRLLAEGMKKCSLEQIAELELKRIYSWFTMKDSCTKRRYKNYCEIYSPSELKFLLMSSYNSILLSAANPQNSNG